jgi:hypothetical protein
LISTPRCRLQLVDDVVAIRVTVPVALLEEL